MAEGCRQRGRLAQATTAGRSHVPLAGEGQLGSFGALNLVADPQGVRFGTRHYLVCL